MNQEEKGHGEKMKRLCIWGGGKAEQSFHLDSPTEREKRAADREGDADEDWIGRNIQGVRQIG